jgi:hypothetical protein
LTPQKVAKYTGDWNFSYLEVKVYMNHPFRFGLGMAILVWACLAVDSAWSQSAAKSAAARPAAAAGPAAAAAAPARPAAGALAATGTNAAWTTAPSPFRKLAPGVMQDVVLDRNADETVQVHDFTELLYFDPSFDFAKAVPFRHEVWMLEFKHKPMRMIWADIPGPNARMQRKQVWYMVYQVTNLGQVLRSVEQPNDKLYKLYKLATVDKPVRFAPVLTLEVHNTLRQEVEGSAKGIEQSIEQCIPIVLPAIRAREDKNREFLTSEQMPLKEIRVGETVWGVATWQDIDPNNVWFSVYVEGLTNAYKVSDDLGKYAAFKNGTSKAAFREIRTKVLKLNFWRPGDEFTVRDNQVRNGVPDLPGGPPARPASEWVWWRSYPPPPANKPVPPATPN